MEKALFLDAESPKTLEETTHTSRQLTTLTLSSFLSSTFLSLWPHLTPFTLTDSHLTRQNNQPPTPVLELVVQVRKWRQEINAQQRALDRQKRGIEAEEMKAKKMVKQMAKKGDIRTCKILAKELVRSRRQKDRIVTSKAQLNSISMQLQHQLCKSVFLSIDKFSHFLACFVCIPVVNVMKIRVLG